MKVFVVTSTKFDSTDVKGVFWTRQVAQQVATATNRETDARTRLSDMPLVRVHTVSIEPLSWLVNAYAKWRGLKDPDASASLMFLTSEIGELNDAYVSTQGGWIRNHPEAKAGLNITFEIGDALMMLTKFAEKVNVDPLDAMHAKMSSKGWDGS